MEYKKILFLSNHFITLYSFRKELIQKLVQDGHEIYISMPADEQNQFFVELGCHIVNTPMSRRGMNPFEDIKLIFQYKKIMREIQPDVIFSYTIKPNIYGCMASNALHFKQVCNVTGTGATFLQESVLSKLARCLYRFSIKKAYKVFFQNTGDRDYFTQHGLVKNNYEILPGSGVNLEQYPYTPMPQSDTINFIFIGRVMKLKGIDEYLMCAKVIRSEYPNTRFYIAGWNEEPDYKQIVAQYQSEGIVEYLGFQKNIAEWMKKCHCTILPSHGGEGVPNVLLESAATGRICIGSNIHGTADVIDDTKSGFLFEVCNANSLIEAVRKVMLLTSEQRSAMGLAGRQKVEKEFNRQIVLAKYLLEVENGL